MAESVVDHTLLESIRLTENSRADDISPKGAVGEYQMMPDAWNEASKALVDNGILQKPVPFDRANDGLYAAPHALQFLKIQEQRLSSRIEGWDRLPVDTKRAYLAGSYNAGAEGFAKSLERVGGDAALLDIPETREYLKRFQSTPTERQSVPKGVSLPLIKTPIADDAPLEMVSEALQTNVEHVKTLLELHQTAQRNGNYIEGLLNAADLSLTASGDYTRGALAGEPGERLTPKEFLGGEEPVTFVTDDNQVRTSMNAPEGTRFQNLWRETTTAVLTDPVPWLVVKGAKILNKVFGSGKAIPALLYTKQKGTAHFLYEPQARVMTNQGAGTVEVADSARGGQSLVIKLDGREDRVALRHDQVVPMAEHFNFPKNDAGLPVVHPRAAVPTIEEISKRYKAMLTEKMVPHTEALTPQRQKVLTDLQKNIGALQSRLGKLESKRRLSKRERAALRTIRQELDGLREQEAEFNRVVGRFHDADRERQAQEIIRDQKVSSQSLEGVQAHEPANSQEVRAAVLLEEELLEELDRQTQRWLITGDPDDKAAAMAYVDLFAKTDPGVRGYVATAARAERASTTSELSKETGQTIREGERATDEQILVRLALLREKHQKQRTLREGSKFSWKKIFLDDFYLSGMTAIAAPKIFLTNQMYIGLQALELGFASVLPGKSMSMLEMPAFVSGWLSSFGDWALHSAKFRAFKEEAATKGFDHRLGPIQFGHWNFKNLTPMQMPFEALAGVMRWNPLGRGGIQSADLMTRFNMREAVVRQLSVRQAVQETRREMGASRFYHPLTFRQKMRDNYRRLKENPGEAILEESNLLGAYTTMSRRLEGALTGSLQGFGQTATGKITAPYLSVTYQTGAAVGERTIFGALSPNVWREFLAGGPRAKIAFSKIALGSSLAAWSSTLASNRFVNSDMNSLFVTPDNIINRHEDDWISGTFRGSALGWFDESTGKTRYVSCEGLDPICGVLKTGANFSAAMTYLDEDDPLVGEMAHAMAAVMLNIITNPLSRGEWDEMHAAFFGEESKPDLALKWVARKASAFIPLNAMGAAYTRQFEEFQTISDGLWERFLRRWPQAESGQAFWRNGKGELVHLPNGYGPSFINQTILDWIAPLKFVDVDDPVNLIQEDPALAAFAKQRYWPSTPQRTFGHTYLTTHQWMRHRELFGTIKIGGRTFIEAVRHLVTESPTYTKDSPTRQMDTIPREHGGNIPGYRQTLLQDLHKEYMDAADDQLRNEFRSLQLMDKWAGDSKAGLKASEESMKTLLHTMHEDAAKAKQHTRRTKQRVLSVE